jgi:hypothetical protein
MSSAEPKAHGHDASASYSEEDRPRNGIISGIVVVIIVTIVIVVIGVVQLFGKAVRKEISGKRLSATSEELRAHRAEEQSKLSRWQWGNQKEGIVRIPVDRAKEIVLRDYAAASAAAPIAPAPTVAPAPVPAPSMSASSGPESWASAAPSGSASAPPAPSTAPAPSASAKKTP